MVQMTPLEERLTEALAARAHQVDEVDLAPAELPGPHRRHLGLVVFAAAACTALVIGVPYAIAQLDGSENAHPPATTPTPTPSPDASGWPIAGSSRVDLDGDGTPDSVRLRIGPPVGPGADSPLPARIEVDLADGLVSTVITEGTDYHLEGSADLPGSDGEELLVEVGRSLRVLDLVDGQLEELEPASDPPLAKRADGQGRLASWVVEDGDLFTLRSTDPVTDQSRYAVERWQWRIADGSLVARQVDGGCVEADSPLQVVGCAPAVPARLTPLGPTHFRIGSEVDMPFAIDGEPVRARLVITDPEWPGGDGFPDGVVELVVTAGPRTWRVALPGGPIPMLFTFTAGRVAVSPTDGDFANIVVGRFGNVDTYWEVYHFVDGEFVRLTTPSTGPTLGITYDDPPHSFPPPTRRTLSYAWVQGSWIYSWHGDGERKQVYRWEQTGRSLNPVSIGTYCTDGYELARC